MECIPFRRPRNQLAKLKKHRSIIFQNVPINASKSSTNASIQRLSPDRKQKKNSGTSEENSAALTTSVCLPSGAVVQIPISLMQSTSHTKLQEKKRGKRSPPSDNNLGRMNTRDVLYSTSKRKGLSETDTQQSFKSSRKRGRFNRKGFWRRIRFLSCCGAVSCDSSPESRDSRKKSPLPTIYETTSMRA